MTAVDIFLIIIFVAICGLAVYRRLLRQLMSAGVLYLATIVAGLLYRPATRFFTVIVGSNVRLAQAILFWIVFLAAVIALEVLLRAGFPDVRLPQIGFLDYALALVPGVVSALIVTSMLLATLAFLSGGRGAAYQQAALRPLLQQFLQLYVAAHQLWFPTPLRILAAALP